MKDKYNVEYMVVDILTKKLLYAESCVIKSYDIKEISYHSVRLQEKFLNCYIMIKMS